MLTKDDKTLLGYYANKIWVWLKGKTATTTENGMMSKEDKMHLDYLWRTYGETDTDDPDSPPEGDGGSEEEAPV